MNTQFAFHDLKIRTHPEIYLSFDSSIRSAINSPSKQSWLSTKDMSSQQTENSKYVLELLSNR